MEGTYILNCVLTQILAPFFWSMCILLDHFLMLFSTSTGNTGQHTTPHYWGCLVFSQPLPKIHTPINIWKICIDLRLFSKCFTVPFLRPLRSKDNRCWILRLRPRNFVIIFESLAANLKKVRQTSVWQTVPKFWFIWLWYLSFCITYKSKFLRNNKKDK